MSNFITLKLPPLFLHPSRFEMAKIQKITCLHVTCSVQQIYEIVLNAGDITAVCKRRSYVRAGFFTDHQIGRPMRAKIKWSTQCKLS